jgi:cell division septum initiation protein DivIVA
VRIVSAIGGPQVDTEALVRRVIDIVEGTRALPLSSSVKLDNKDEVLELLEEAVARLPEEVRSARWLLKERDEHLEKVRREADEIIDAARERAERMVQRTEIVRQANATARRTVEEARDEARRLRLEAEDYCDQKLAAFEIVLERTLKTVNAGRQKLSVTPSPLPADTPIGMAIDEAQANASAEAFFDQEQA